MFTSQKVVMVVDDEEDTAEMIAEMARLSGYQPILTSGGNSAIQMITKERPDVVVLDVMMPDVSGLDVLRFIRRDPRLRTIPVILISACDRIEDVQAGMAAGASVYLIKPVAFSDFQGALRQALAPV